MKYYIIIDCGTTNSRAYVVDKAGNVLGISKKTVGVKDVSTSGNKQILISGLREIIDKAIEKAGIKETEVIALLSSGMITSEIGLMEIPHATAPCNISELSRSISCLDDCELLPGKKLYLIRGIKNPIPMEKEELEQVGLLDFMRGEETQAAGIIAKGRIPLPAVVVILSSHTKFIPITGEGSISGSLTTL
ncbi:MAG: 2-dehydro-3-deoxygalactonokinase, partial [Oscillospiraceae bacterium]|nr:2-dehydro-3-deoxygalactonokinase [Oscillospiraceae bacterium]